LPPDAQPFDLLVINICSLSWSDVEAAGLMSHPLWSHFDILFKRVAAAAPSPQATTSRPTKKFNGCFSGQIYIWPDLLF
ncbi:cellulose biosynthesis protein BcsG, partial [Salmonella enterica subsp. enterica serovar Cerro]|nr:cellulose biosynthesis protein BcsG [Salmonella enterica subsp. enterica serovar Cerro]